MRNTSITFRRTRVGSATIAYQEAGDGPPVVLIHGLSGSSRWWARNIGPLAERFHVYVIDLIGFGDSRGGQRFMLDKAADYLARWMDQLGITRSSLVGHSMGGYIAAELAADAPERVERVVLVDAAALPFEQSFGWHFASMLRELQHLPPDFFPTLLFDALRAGPATLWDAATALMRADLRPKLERIAAPTLVVWGERDAIVPLALGKQLTRLLPEREMLVIKNAGHNPMWDCPQAFNREVAAFLLGSEQGSTPREVACEPMPAENDEVDSLAQIQTRFRA
ncbi:MAG TPA: alpha/beta hydrolase [Roseiflexaceae bacterium]|nr:alpha/beta hydrolase [Roseiflexaceae bacterium]